MPSLSGKAKTARRPGDLPAATGWEKAFSLACIIGLTALVYLPSLSNGYIWDDDSYVFGSTWSTSPEPLRAIWLSRTETPQYYPLVFTLFWAGYRLWGFAPFGFHLINLVLHIANALLVWALARRLFPRAALAVALLFAVHPIQVETVAWITELKNVLSLFFFLLACLAFLAYDENKKPLAYVLSFIFFLGAMLSKSITASFAAVPILYSWWRRDTVRPWDFVITLPFALVGAAGAANTIWLELYHVNTRGMNFVIPLAERLVLLGRTTLFYLYKALVPVNFVFFYPRWRVDPTRIGQWTGSLIVVALIIVLVLARRRVGRGPAALFIFYCLSISPASGMFDVFPMIYSYIADHFSYLSSPAIFLMLVSGFMKTGAWLQARYPWTRGGVARCLLIATATAGLILLAAETGTLQANYKNGETLWRSVIAKNPECSIAYNNLATEIEATDPKEALALLQKAVALNPQYTNALNNIGTLYLESGRAEAALPYLEKALLTNADLPWIHHNLGVACLGLKQYDKAIDCFAQALRLDPSRRNSVLKIVDAIIEKRVDQGLSASRTDKAGSQTCNQAGTLIGRQGDYKSAITVFQEAVARDPGNSEAYNNLGFTCYLTGDYDGAVICFRQAIAVDPGCQTARRNLERVQALMAGSAAGLQ